MALSVHRHLNADYNPHLTPRVQPVEDHETASEDAAAKEHCLEVWLMAGAPAERFDEAWTVLTTACHYDNLKALFGRFWDAGRRVAEIDPHREKWDPDGVFHDWFAALIAKHPHQSKVAK